MKRYDLEQGWAAGERATMAESKHGDYVRVDDPEFAALVALAKFGKWALDEFSEALYDADGEGALAEAEALGLVKDGNCTALAKLPEGI